MAGPVEDDGYEGHEPEESGEGAVAVPSGVPEHRAGQVEQREAGSDEGDIGGRARGRGPPGRSSSRKPDEDRPDAPAMARNPRPRVRLKRCVEAGQEEVRAEERQQADAR